MVLKRQLRDSEDEVPSPESKQKLTFANFDGDFMKGFSTELLIKLEPIFRNVVRDEVQRSIELFRHQSLRPLLGKNDSPRSRAGELFFVDKLPRSLFTGNKVESEGGQPIRVVIRDAVTKNIIKSGPLSSLKIEILVLDGDFGSDDQEDWSEDEFKANLVREREGKKPLLVGELRITLTDGVGVVENVVFTDNSSWIRGRRFRLGAKIVQGIYNGGRIREAKSEAFVVKDHRGDSYKKHHPPTMEDEVWRLEKIAKDGVSHKRLAGKGITTVGDFTRLLHVDPKQLRNALGGGISNRTWEQIIEHATECTVNEQLYAYHMDITIALVFDSVFKLVGVIFNGQDYQSLDNLNNLQMELVKNMKERAYKNVNAWVPLDDLSVSAFGTAMPSSDLQPEQYSSPSSGLEQVPSMQQDKLEMQPAPNYMTQPSYAGDVQDTGFTETIYSVGPYTSDDSQIGHLITENCFSFCQSP